MIDLKQLNRFQLLRALQAVYGFDPADLNHIATIRLMTSLTDSQRARVMTYVEGK